MPTSFNTVVILDDGSAEKLLEALNSKKKIKIFSKPVKVKSDPEKLREIIKKVSAYKENSQK